MTCYLAGCSFNIFYLLRKFELSVYVRILAFCKITVAGWVLCHSKLWYHWKALILYRSAHLRTIAYFPYRFLPTQSSGPWKLIQILGHLHSVGKAWTQFQLLVPSWLTTGCCKHLENELVREGVSVFLCYTSPQFSSPQK